MSLKELAKHETFSDPNLNKKLTQFYNTVLFETPSGQRFTQDSPILANVWLAYARNPNQAVDLILTTKYGESTGKTAKMIRERLAKHREIRAEMFGDETREHHRLTYLPGQIAVRLYFDELVSIALPQTPWWSDVTRDFNENKFHYKGKPIEDYLSADLERFLTDRLMVMREGIGGAVDEAEAIEQKTNDEGVRLDASRVSIEFVWLVRIAGLIAHSASAAWDEADSSGVTVDIPSMKDSVSKSFNLDFLLRSFNSKGSTMEAGQSIQSKSVAKKARKKVVEAFLGLFRLKPDAGVAPTVWRITRNREAELAVESSRLTVKADAAIRLFDISCRNVTWAVIDSGIDTHHPAFKDAAKAKPGDPVKALQSRVTKTFDFTNLRELLDPELKDHEPAAYADLKTVLQQRRSVGNKKVSKRQIEADLKELRSRILDGQEIDWQLLESLIQDREPKCPQNDHGTHVAGVLAADWLKDDKETQALPGAERGRVLQGICPDINLYDCRVFREDGQTDEFEIIAAVQFIRWLNSRAGETVVHGINMSVSLVHEVRRYACGQTPICVECNEAVCLGLVIVAAAGNRGFEQEDLHMTGRARGYRAISITDPANADKVIAVGSTHRKRPFEYGVSYFSSRGPTGDGRMKPDLVAPGEKITGPTPNNGIENKDGTSMAAPHVSGAAALLMARNKEFVAKPERIKQILCSSTTDLGRYDYFQGAGLLDILRAMQEV